MNIIGKKNIYFLISFLIIIPGILAVIFYGLNLSIDFTGGSRITMSFGQPVNDKAVNLVKSEMSAQKIKISTIERSNNLLFVRTQPIDQSQNSKLVNSLKKDFANFKEEEFETIGPSVGAETTRNAVQGVILASFLIVLYITYSFRKVPKPASSFRFGVCAVAALVHDVFVVVGIFAILGHFFGVEIDSLFVTAVLTVIGFSVHDTIVVFDRIRENLKRNPSHAFGQVVNDSILQTLDRSLNTSLTVVLVLLAVLLFGGETIRWFIVALLVGIVSGTYSSVFNASPLLVLWQELRGKK